MKNKKGFTLVELLGVIVVLAIVFGLAVVGYIGVQNQMKKAYYSDLEENIKLAGTEYYNYNKDSQPEAFGEIEKVEIVNLVTNNYIEDVKNRNKESCSGYVGAYKKANDKIEYFVCLDCGEDYKTNTNQCNGIMDINTEVQIPGKSLCENLTYNGSEQELVKNTPIGYTLSNHIGINAGNYTITATLLTGYKWSDNTTNNKTFTCSIKKATPKITLSDNEGVIEKNLTIYFTEKADVNGTYKNEIKDNNIGTVSPVNSATVIAANTEAQVSIFAKNVGKSKINITFTPTDTNNYNLVKETYDLEVIQISAKPAKPTAADACKVTSYNGEEQILTKITSQGYSFIGNKGTNAGTYTITAKLQDGYIWSDDTTNDVQFNCSIAKAVPTIEFNSSEGSVVVGGTTGFNAKSNVEGTYSTTSNNTSVAITELAHPGDVIEKNTNTFVRATGVPYGGGNDAIITVTINPTDTINYTTNSKTWTAHILLASTKPTNSMCVARTYTGSAQTLTKATEGTGFTLSGYSKTSVGTYTITASLKSGYRWTDNSTANVTFECSIERSKTATTGACLNPTYNGSAQNLAGNGTNVTYTNNSQTNYKTSGTYTVTVTPNSNYAWSDGTYASKTLNCNIARRTLSVTAAAKSKTYGTANPTLTYTYSGNVSGETPEFSGALTTNATTSSSVGSYDITQGTLALANGTNFTTSNYTLSYTKASLTITRAKTATTGACLNPTYNGSAQNLAGNGTNVTYTNNSQTNRKASGTYAVTVTPTSNYAWSDGTYSAKTLNCNINKAQPTIAINQDAPGIVFNDGQKYINGTLRSGTDNDITGTLTISSNNTNAATVKFHKKIEKDDTDTTRYNITFSGTNNNPISYGIYIIGNDITEKISNSATITLSFTPNSSYATNYNNASQTYVVNVYNKATVGSCIDDVVYNGSSQTIVTPVGPSTDYRIVDGFTWSKTHGTDVGDYNITATLSSTYMWDDYSTGTKQITCSIKKAADTITMIPNLYAVYDGKAHKASFSAASGSSVSVTYYTDSKCKNDITGSPKNVGTYYAKASTTASDNYKAGALTCTTNPAVVISEPIPPEATITISSLKDRRYIPVTCDANVNIKTFKVGGTTVTVPSNSQSLSYDYDLSACNSSTYTGNDVSIEVTCEPTGGAKVTKTSSKYKCARSSVCGSGETTTTYGAWSSYTNMACTSSTSTTEYSCYVASSDYTYPCMCKHRSITTKTTYPYCWH